MSLAFLIVLFAVLAILVGVFAVITKYLEEFEHAFVYITWTVVLFIIGGAAYLTIATPTFANPPLTSSQTTFVAPPTDTNLLKE